MCLELKPVVFYRIVGLLFLLHNCLFGQATLEDLSFINVDQNPTQRAITGMIHDDKKNLWIGTFGEGLLKFDGTNFTVYKQDWTDKEGLRSSTISALFMDEEKNIWVGTEEGLYTYSLSNNRFIRIALDGDKKVPVHAIANNNSGELLVGTHQFGLFKVELKDFTHERIPLRGNSYLPQLEINSIVKMDSLSSLVGTNQGLMLYSHEDSVFKKLSAVYKETNLLAQLPVKSLLKDENGVFWAGTYGDGLLKITEDNKEELIFKNFPITDKRILSLSKSQEGFIWCGTENDGLIVLNSSGKVLKNFRYSKTDPYGVKSNSIWTVFVDSENRIWLGYYDRGLDVFDKNQNKFKSLYNKKGFPNLTDFNSVTGLALGQDGSLWMGIVGSGVVIYDTKSGRFTNLNELENLETKGFNSENIPSIFIDSRETVWIGTWSSGLYFLDKGATEFKQINKDNSGGQLLTNRVMSFSEDSKGTVWIGTFSGGLISYNPKSQSFTHHNSAVFNDNNLSNSNIRSVVVDQDDTIWLGTRKGLFRVTTDKNNTYKVGAFQSQMALASKGNFNSNVILSLYVDQNKNIWIGTSGSGLFQYFPSKDRFKWYSKSDGLQQELITAMIEDNSGKLWFSGNNGISSFAPNEEAFVNYDTFDGLLTDDFNPNTAVKDTRGNIYFGNFKGINYFNPDNIIYNENIPNVYFTNLRLENKITSPEMENSPLKKVFSATDSIVLKPNQRVFTIEYVGSGFTRSNENQYAYYLEGFQDTWNYVGNERKATYTNLPAGEYLFKVKAANNDGVWNEVPKVLHIKIRPYWWNSNMAWVIYFLVFFIFNYGIYYTINQRINERRNLKFEQQKNRQIKNLNDKKLQFFTNISHEFKTPLTLILNPMEELLDSKEGTESDAVQSKYKTIYKNTKRLVRLIDELMDFRKLQFHKLPLHATEIELKPFLEEILDHFKEEAISQNISLKLNYDTTEASLWGDPSMLEKILFNLLSNAFKVTPPSGEIGLFVSSEKAVLKSNKKLIPFLKIQVEDTGTGIKKENLKKIFDRFYQANEMNKQYYGGTGIGLELVRSLVDLHQGKIEIESAERSGTTFNLFFPLGNTHFDAEQLQITKNQIPLVTINETDLPNIDEITTVEGTSKCALVVEDNLELRTYLKTALSKHYKVLVAVNGLEGYNQALKYLPDVIITDVMMPVMDGFEFSKRIKKDPKTNHIPILMLTAKTFYEDQVKGIDIGADVYLKKPFSITLLRAHLKQLINSRDVLFEKYNKYALSSNETTSLDKEFLQAVLNYVNENIHENDLNVERLSEKLSISRSNLYRRIKKITGITANEFIRNIRLEKSKNLIEKTEFTISEISFKVGFSSPSYFNKCFVNKYGSSPNKLRNSSKQNEADKSLQ